MLQGGRMDTDNQIIIHFKDPFNLVSPAAPILYSESFSERKLFHAFF
jgi:hypothetical protein